MPQIGKLERITETTFTIQWLEEEYNAKWKFWKNRRKIIQETFPLRAIIKELNLNDNMELTSEQIEDIKQSYENAEFV